MHEQPAYRLSPSQASTIDFARRDLELVRAADLASLESTALLMQVERLKSRLDDVLHVVDEIAVA
ncbi:hypothetical protein GKQ77_01515 [Streptomyces sp. BG9H]|uniref:Uncharacterized protein n=1 Tax=Streptomyces anatolicus TaxID=2675858 RepID=A0ABS6YFT2_9ACTN|nr:hypothetical protein [Streptomyces anatolicus]MBW5420248.1 hypothetical protein [Streptomyces anatolicus]